MLVAPPGHLKTTAAEILEEYERTLIISDTTVKSLVGMREDILSGNICTLIYSDYAKIHKRHPSVSSNMEGINMALVAEGFRKPAYSDQRVQALPARATIVGCMTPKFSEEMEAMWLDNGFYRRFIWCRYRLDSPDFLEDAIGHWRRAELDEDFTMKKIPSNRQIPYSLDDSEAASIRHSLRFMLDKKIPYILAQKILCVLKWKFRNPKKAMDIWKDFAESLTKDGATVITNNHHKAASS